MTRLGHRGGRKTTVVYVRRLLLAEGTEWRFLNELKREMKG